MLLYNYRQEVPVFMASLEEPVAQGRSRNVYLLPKHTLLLVKVQKVDPAPRRFFRKCRLLAAIRRYYKQVIPLQREVREYARTATEGNRTFRHMQRFVGVIKTPHGKGLVVKAVRRKNGGLAMSLRDIVSCGHFDAETHAALQEFLRWFVASSVVAADVHLDNIVFDEENSTMVLIDGIGDKTFLPMRAWFPWLNRANKKRLAKTIYSQAAIHVMETVTKKKTLVLMLIFAGVAFGIDIQDGALIDG